nr:unnamed protein product [Digitaria exilis]
MSSSASGARGKEGPGAFSVDLAAAARRLLAFLRAAPTGVGPRSVRRYEELWLPLAAAESGAGGGEAAMLLPPPDVQLVWLCHCFHHYAEDRCRDVWAVHYPSEPFDLHSNEIDGNVDGNACDNASGELMEMVRQYAGLAAHFASPFVREAVYHVAARQRYMRFLELIKKVVGTIQEQVRLVPSLDILLMWLAHQSFPVSYAKDMVALAVMDSVAKVGVAYGEVVNEEVESTRALWEDAYDEPYDMAGSEVDAAAVRAAREAFYWTPAASEEDVNRLYKSLQPRFMMEVYVFLKGGTDKEHINKEFLRLRTQRCHRSLKLNKSMANLSCKNWQKTWHLYCEFATRGLIIELRRTTSGCFRNSKFLKNISFSWSDMLHEKALALTDEIEVRLRAMASITPPVQAPYLLKCVPDRVTDDGGAMISDVILRMRNYRPQEGRWLTRTVLDHGGRECFVIRMRIGRGIWRRGAETPTAVKWEDRSIEVREGSWSYVASTSSVGYAPEKVVGTAMAMKDQQENKVVWNLSTGDILTARLLVGRRLSYRVNTDRALGNHNEEEQYLTLVRKSRDHHGDRATVLLNWKLLAVEFLPEEDAVFVLLLCMVIARTMTEIRREDVSGLLVRRRIGEARVGQRDWGSVILPDFLSPDPNLQPWYRNAAQVLTSQETGAILTKYSPADGKDLLYRQALIP